MSASASEPIDRKRLVAKTFTVALLLEQSEPWRVSQFVKEAEPWGFFAELEPPIPPLWSDHDLTGLEATFTGIDGTQLALVPTLRRRNEKGVIVLFFPRQRAVELPIGTRVKFREGHRNDA